MNNTDKIMTHIAYAVYLLSIAIIFNIVRKVFGGDALILTAAIMTYANSLIFINKRADK
ncbi:MAG: hypothetical protein PHD53_00100 [Methylococcales bacterium]|nr:hypothetical protein [Methylococcales bacterium]